MDNPLLNHNDQPHYLADGFDQSDFINEICQLIVNANPPKGIGVNGYWGTGKTTALLKIYCKFSSQDPFGEAVESKFNRKFRDKKIIPIWFEAWRFQHDSLPIVALLNEIRAQINLWNQLPKKTKKLGTIALLGFGRAVEETIKAATGGLIQLSNIQAAGEKYEADHYLNPLSSQKIHQLLEEAVDALSNNAKNKYKLLILIDDLDRCRPKKALALMEGIKIHLNLKNCIVLFGMDQRQVEQALVSALGLSQNISNDDEGKQQQARICHQAQEYLEKICQDIHHIPVPDQQAKTAYFIQLLNEIQDIDNTDKAECKMVLQAFDCLPANPRKIKALVNRLAIMLKKATLDEEERLEDIANTDLEPR